MTRPGARQTGPLLFTTSLRDWQARYKARRAAATDQALQAGPSSTEAAPEDQAAAGTSATREGGPGR